MSNNNGQNENFSKNFDATEEEVYNALIELGWLLPRNEEELRRAEKSLETVECPPFPPELKDPAPLIERLRKEQEEKSNQKTLEDEKPKNHLRLVAGNQKSGEAETGDKPDAANRETSEVEEEYAPSFAALLRREIPNETPSVVAGNLGVNVGFIKLASDNRESLPNSWRDELAKEANNLYSIAEWRSKHTLTNRSSFQQQAAASRAMPYSNRKMDWREILQKANLHPDREAHYRHLAEREEEEEKEQ